MFIISGWFCLLQNGFLIYFLPQELESGVIPLLIPTPNTLSESGNNRDRFVVVFLFAGVCVCARALESL